MNRRVVHHRFGTGNVPTYLGKRSLTNCLGTFFERLEITEIPFTKIQPTIERCPENHYGRTLQEINSDKTKSFSIGIFLDDHYQPIIDPERVAASDLFELRMGSKTFLSLVSQKIQRLQELNEREILEERTGFPREYFATRNHMVYSEMTVDQCVQVLLPIATFARLCHSPQVNTTLGDFVGDRAEVFKRTAEILTNAVERIRSFHPQFILGVENTGQFLNVLGTVDEIQTLCKESNAIVPIFNLRNFQEEAAIENPTSDELYEGWERLMSARTDIGLPPLMIIQTENFYDHMEIKRAILTNRLDYVEVLNRFLHRIEVPADVLVRGIVFDLDAIVLRQKYLNL